MDQQAQRGRSPAAGHPQPHIQSHSHSPSPSPYQPGDPSAGLGIGIDQSAQQPFSGAVDSNVDAYTRNTYFDPNANFNQQLPTSGADYNSQSQTDYLSPNLHDGDFSLFPSSGSQGEHYNAPLFEQSTLNPNDINGMASPQPHSSPTPPHLLQPDAHQPGSAQQSPASFSPHQFPSPTHTGGGYHSRNASHTSHASLGPEAALLPNQMGDWSQPQFQGHRRSPSAHSDVSSVSPSPNMVSSDTFDDASGHSPLQRASDGYLYQGDLGIGSFSISDPAAGSPNLQGRSPSHSPAISPRIMPQQMAQLSQPPGYELSTPGGGYGDGSGYAGEAFPNLQQGSADMSQIVPPSINIDFAPNNNSRMMGAYEGGKELDVDSLTPPERG